MWRECAPKYIDGIGLQRLAMRDHDTLEGPRQHSLEEGSRDVAVSEQEQPSGSARAEPRRYASQLPERPIEPTLEGHHVKRKVGENQGRG
jgi:hypothetical protein